MKSKRGLYFSVLGLTLFCAPLMAGCSNSSSNNNIFTSEKTIVLNNKTKICRWTNYHDGDGTINFGNANYNFNYKKIYSAGESYWQNIGAGGYFYNTTRIDGIKKIKINFIKGKEDFNFKIEWSKDTTFSEGYYQDFNTFNTVVNFDFNSYVPNYFRFTNLGSSYLIIDSMELIYTGELRFPTYTVTTENENKGTIYSSLSNGITNSGTSYTIYANSKDGYTFDGWYDKKNGRLFTSDLYLTSTVESQDVILEARFKESSDNTYKIFTLPGDNGTVSIIGNYVAGTEMKLVSSPNSNYASYGWFDTNGDLVTSDASYEFTMPKHDLIYSTKFGIGHNLNVKVKGEGVDPEDSYVDAPSFVAVNKTITLKAHPDFHRGLAFDKWVDNKKNVVSTDSEYTFNMTDHDLYLTACFKKGLRLNVYSSNDSLGGVTGTGFYLENHKVNVTAKPYGDNIFVGWYESFIFNEHACLTAEKTYTYTFGNKAANLVARFMTPQEYKTWMGNFVNPKNIGETTLTYGMYPQSYVGTCGDTSNDIVTNLDRCIPNKDLYNYILYKEEYYVKAKADTYPYADTHFSSNGIQVEKGKEYYFRVEPIVWNILSTNDGTYKLECSNAVAAHQYAPVSTEYDDEHFNDGILLTYDKSAMRTWLNNDFYKQAFLTATDYIQETKVDNSAESTGRANNTYVCADTIEKVYLGSVKDYMNRDEALNIKSNSDYALCFGARNGHNDKSIYCTRSIGYFPLLFCEAPLLGLVSGDGKLYGYYDVYIYRDYRVAVAPQMTIKI